MVEKYFNFISLHAENLSVILKFLFSSYASQFNTKHFKFLQDIMHKRKLAISLCVYIFVYNYDVEKLPTPKFNL